MSDPSIKPATRLFVEPELAAGATIELAADQAHFLGRVLRLQAGANLCLFNGRDGEWLAVIDDIGKRSASLRATEQRRAQPTGPAGPILIIPPIKKARADWLVEKATEMGVSAIHPVLTERTSVRDVNLDRWRKITIEAAEQCERLDLPSLQPLSRLFQALERLRDHNDVLWAAERLEAPPITAGLVADFSSLALLIGPEGGFAPAELDALAELPFVHAISLGPRILRAETAALAGLTLLQASAP
ncbi:MAG: 16S rRNA (uracil(1498)-N(3))-methyltransferase [Alphaproteobacteria bacterium]|nr:16S rRNA (uracil(1498)-N(3))-methyltransferase [Alphaproteobacteria bacterium SS10]